MLVLGVWTFIDEERAVLARITTCANGDGALTTTTIEQTRIDHNQILRLRALERNTWIVVRVIGNDGRPIGFPRPHIHEGAKGPEARNVVTIA